MSVFDGDGRPALDTSFYFPIDVAFDAGGRPLILDLNNYRLRRINGDGTVGTIVGLDFEGFPIDGALGRETALHHPSDVETDGAFNLYFAGNHAPSVFRVGLDDRVSVLAGSDQPAYDGDGGPARAAHFLAPYGIVVMDDGSFYVADIEAHVVRYVDPGGIIRTVAGTGAAGYGGDGGPGTLGQLDAPVRLRLDDGGNLLIADSNNHAVRRLDASGTITTLAGTGVAGYSGDGGLATAAQFNQPADLRFAPEGDLLVADSGNSVIRRIDRNGIVTTVVGTGTEGFAGDGAPATQAQLARPSGIAFAPDGALWIADTFNHRVRRVASIDSLVH